MAALSVSDPVARRYAPAAVHGNPTRRRRGHLPRRDRLAAVATLASLMLCGAALPSLADEIRMEPIDDPRAVSDMQAPPRGMTMRRVRDAWGEPQRQQAPVGDPPISRWEYDDFVVYFEYRYVLHSVVKRAP